MLAVPVAVLGRDGVVGGDFFLSNLPLLLDTPWDSARSGLERMEVMISSEVRYSCTGSLFDDEEKNLVSIMNGVNVVVGYNNGKKVKNERMEWSLVANSSVS